MALLERLRNLSPFNAGRPAAAPRKVDVTRLDDGRSLYNSWQASFATTPKAAHKFGARNESLGAARVGITQLNGKTSCWDGQTLDVDVNACGIEYHGQWRAVMFPYVGNGGFEWEVTAKGPTGAPAAFAALDYAFHFVTPQGWTCVSNRARTGPFGTANIKIQQTVPIMDTWLGPLGAGFFHVQLKRFGIVVAASGSPPDAGWLSGAFLVTENQGRVGTCPPPF